MQLLITLTASLNAAAALLQESIACTSAAVNCKRRVGPVLIKNPGHLRCFCRGILLVPAL